MVLINEKIKLLSCSEFRVFLKKLVKDKIEKEWSTDFIDNMNFIIPKFEPYEYDKERPGVWIEIEEHLNKLKDE